jgi:hypothetical protein
VGESTSHMGITRAEHVEPSDRAVTSSTSPVVNSCFMLNRHHRAPSWWKVVLVCASLRRV